MSDHDIWAPPPAANAGGIHWPPPPFQGRVRARPGRRAGLLVALLAVGALLGGIVAWQLMPDLRAEAERLIPPGTVELYIIEEARDPFIGQSKAVAISGRQTASYTPSGLLPGPLISNGWHDVRTGDRRNGEEASGRKPGRTALVSRGHNSDKNTASFTQVTIRVVQEKFLLPKRLAVAVSLGAAAGGAVAALLLLACPVRTHGAPNTRAPSRSDRTHRPSPGS